jgi:hypothetical protein
MKWTLGLAVSVVVLSTSPEFASAADLPDVSTTKKSAPVGKKARAVPTSEGPTNPCTPPCVLSPQKPILKK